MSKVCKIQPMGFVQMKTGGLLSQPARENTTNLEEPYAERVAFLRSGKIGLFTFTMMMKRERITNSLVTENRSFCMRF
jgi:hypothetical protein